MTTLTSTAAPVATSSFKAEKLEAFGSNAGIIGAFMLAANIPYGELAWIIYLISSVCLLIWNWKNGVKHQMRMQLVFCVANIIGIYRWLIVGG